MQSQSITKVIIKVIYQMKTVIKKTKAIKPAAKAKKITADQKLINAVREIVRDEMRKAKTENLSDVQKQISQGLLQILKDVNHLSL